MAGRDVIERARAGGATSWPLCASTHSVFLWKGVNGHQIGMNGDVLECFGGRDHSCLLSCFVGTCFPVQCVTTSRVGHGAFGMNLVFFPLFLVSFAFFPTLPPFPFFAAISSSLSSLSVTFLGHLCICSAALDLLRVRRGEEAHWRLLWVVGRLDLVVGMV